MNIYNELHFCGVADFEFFRPSAVGYIPHSMECSSRWSTYGSSSGWTSELTKSAVGEYFERKHFYLDVPVDTKGTLANTLTAEEVDAFVRAFSQTSTDQAPENISDHVFDLTNVYRVGDLSGCQIPTACISIAQCRNQVDNQIYPMRDTCGCSAHVRLESAILGALKEFLERQFLLRFWLTRQCSRVIDNEAVCRMLSGSKALPLFRKLCAAGDLCVIDISDERFPGSCLLLCYGNSNDLAKVKYCAGMAYASSTISALEKSLVELWQTLRFMLSLDEDYTDSVADPYLKHFLECNQYQTFVMVTDNLEQRTPLISTMNRAPLTVNLLIDAVRAFSRKGFLYLSSMPLRQSGVYFCKYVSPDGFLHMNNAFACNIDNAYSKDFFHAIVPDHLTKMVPFP